MNQSTFETTAGVIDAVGMEVRVAQHENDKRRAVAALNVAPARRGQDRRGSLWQLVYEGDTLCAVLVWCACAFGLKARDAWIGWDEVTPAKHLKLIVQNRRFLVL